MAPTPRRTAAAILATVLVIAAAACSDGDGDIPNSQAAGPPSVAPEPTSDVTQPDSEPRVTPPPTTEPAPTAPLIDPATASHRWAMSEGWVDLPSAPTDLPTATWTAGQEEGIGAFTQRSSIVTLQAGPAAGQTTVGALDPATAEPIWSTDVALESPLPPRISVLASTVFVEDSARSVLLDAADGRLLAAVQGGTISATTTHVLAAGELIDRRTGAAVPLGRDDVEVRGGSLLFGNESSTFGVIDPATGLPAWDVTDRAPGVVVAIDDTFVHLARGDTSTAITAFELSTGATRWSTQLPSTTGVGARPSGEGLIAVSLFDEADVETLVALDLTDGSIAWEHTLGDGQGVDDIVRSGATTLIVASGPEETEVLDGSTGEPLASADDELDLRPTGGGLAYLALDPDGVGGPVPVIDLTSLTPRWTVDTDGVTSFVQPIPGGFVVPEQRGEGTLFAYQG